MAKKTDQERREAWNKTREKGVRKYQENQKSKVLVPKKRSPVLKSSPKKKSKISRRSKKRAAEERKYNARVKELKEDPNNVCQGKLEGCTGEFSENHHKKGRIGKLLLDEKYWCYLCNNCHRVVELNPDMAKQLGLSVLRLSK